MLTVMSSHSQASTPLNRFLAPLIALRHALPTHGSSEPDVQTLVEANVAQSVKAIVATETIQNNWKQKGSAGVQVHGLGTSARATSLS